jgi:hypothetical protein
VKLEIDCGRIDSDALLKCATTSMDRKYLTLLVLTATVTTGVCKLKFG